MPLATLRRIWLTVSIASLLFALDVMVATQGWPEFLSVDNLIKIGLPDDTIEPLAAYWGIIFLTVLLIGAFWLASLHAHEAKRLGKARWPGCLMGLAANSQPGRVWTLVTILLLGVFPLYTLGHAWRVFNDNIVLCRSIGGNWNEIARGWNAHWKLPENLVWQEYLLGDQLRIGGGCAIHDIEHSVTAFPVFVPLTLVSGLLILLYFVGRTLIAICR